MLEALAKAAFERDVGRLTPRLAAQRGWEIVRSEFPVLEVIFRRPSASPLRVRFTCDGWDDIPPSIALLRLDGSPVQPNSNEDRAMFDRGGSVFNPSAHTQTGQPFVCMRGSREFHTHEGHRGETWDGYRGLSGNDLLGLLDQLSQVWRRAVK